MLLRFILNIARRNSLIAYFGLNLYTIEVSFQEHYDMTFYDNLLLLCVSFDTIAVFWMILVKQSTFC